MTDVQQLEEGGASEMRSGSEPIYPGSHELRIISFYQVESPLVPEGTLALASLERKTGGSLSPELEYSPAQRMALLAELAASIFDQMKQSKEALAKTGLQIE